MCSISTDSLYIPKKIEQCQNNTDKVTVLHPVNLALIQHFFAPETYNSILGDTAFSRPLNIQLPSIRIYNHSFSQILAQDQHLHLSLKKIAQATLKDQTVFKSLSEPLLEGEISVNDSWPDLTGILSIASISLSVLLTIFCIALFNKVRALTAALLLIQKLPQSHSLTMAPPLPSFIYKHLPKPAPTENIQNIFNTQCNPWPFVTLSIFTSFILIAITIYFYKRLNSNNHTQILLEITNGLSCITIPLVRLSLCPTDWDITLPDNITNMKISGILFTRLHADWSDFSIVGTNTKHSVPIPEHIPINPFTAMKLKRVFKTPFFCHILLTHHNYFSRLK